MEFFFNSLIIFETNIRKLQRWPYHQLNMPFYKGTGKTEKLHWLSFIAGKDFEERTRLGISQRGLYQLS